MAKKRKTVSERRQERADAERRAWTEFEPKLAALQTFAEALTLVSRAPPPDSPGRKFYSNLGFFLQAFNVPYGSNAAERVHYITFIERLDQAGALKPGAGKTVIAALNASLARESL